MGYEELRSMSKLIDETYAMMTESQSRVVSMLETWGVDPCPAIKLSEEIMKPAFRAWSRLVEAQATPGSEEVQ